MPLMDGFESVRRLRTWEEQQPAERRTRAVAVSANSDDEGCHAECLAAGFDVVHAKPLSVTKLREILHEAAVL